MDVPLLRKMTEKSVLGFGKFADCRVGDVIKLNHTRYLRWCYFNLAKISFVDEVMTKIKLLPEFQIEKPGTNPEKGKELDEYYDMMRSPTDNLFRNNHSRRKKKAQHLQRFKRDKIFYSKGAMQARNHGR